MPVYVIIHPFSFPKNLGKLKKNAYMEKLKRLKIGVENIDRIYR